MADFLFRLDRELEHNIFAGQGLVNGGEGLELGLDIDLVLRVEVDLKEFGAVQTASGALANNFSRVDEVLEGTLETEQGYEKNSACMKLERKTKDKGRKGRSMQAI